MNKSLYKYLYEIKQTNPKPGEAIYYRGWRISKVEPEQDLWIKYFTSSKLVAKKIEEDGIDAFEIVEIKPMPEDCHILHKEHSYLIEVDAKNNPIYFNQHNNDGYDNPEAGRRICPHCYHKNYGHPFEPCWNCGKLMTKHSCTKCNAELQSSFERCECGYSRLDDISYQCIKCGNDLKTLNERCSCGYSRLDELNYICIKCGNELTNFNKRCSCGYSRVDDANYLCSKCGTELTSSTERCACGDSRIDDVNYSCLKCRNKLKSPNQRCSCGYSRCDEINYLCAKCGNNLKSPAERCSCGYYRNDDIKHCCLKCGNVL